jgi:hypothetical protein
VARSGNHFALETQQCFLCVLVVVVPIVELHVTVQCIKILSAAQQRFYCKLMLRTTMEIIRDSL